MQKRKRNNNSNTHGGKRGRATGRPVGLGGTRLERVPANLVRSHILPHLSAGNSYHLSQASTRHHDDALTNWVDKLARQARMAQRVDRLVEAAALKVRAAIIRGIAGYYFSNRPHVTHTARVHMHIPTLEFDIRPTTLRPGPPFLIEVFWGQDFQAEGSIRPRHVATPSGDVIAADIAQLRSRAKIGATDKVMLALAKRVLARAGELYAQHPVLAD